MIWIPYVYKLTFEFPEELDMFYIGSKTGKDANPDIFWKRGGYFTSSKVVHGLIKEHGTSSTYWKREIIKSGFETAKEALQFEYALLVENNAATNERFLNKCITGGFIGTADYNYHSKEICDAISEANKGKSQYKSVGTREVVKLSINDPKVLNGEVVGVNTGIGTYRSLLTGETIQLPTNDPKVLTGEVVGHSFGTGSYRNKNTNEIIQLPTNDPKVLNGEVVGVNTNMATYRVKATGETIQLPVDHEYVTSGIVEGSTRGMATYRVKATEEIIQLSINDPKVLTEEVVGVNTGISSDSYGKSKYFDAIDKDGNEYLNRQNLKKFCMEHPENLNSRKFKRCFQGKTKNGKTTCGWTVRPARKTTNSVQEI